MPPAPAEKTTASHAPPPKELGTADPDISSWTPSLLLLPQRVRAEARAVQSRAEPLRMFFLRASRRGRPVLPADAGGLAKGAASSWEDLQLFTLLMWEIGD